ncbi:MAG: hypothetical protein V1865_01810 [bacterium]
MKSFFVFVVLLVLSGCAKKEKLEIQVVSFSVYSQERSLRSKLAKVARQVLEQDDIEIITPDNYLIQCALISDLDINKEIKSILIKWNFCNLDNPSKNYPIKSFDQMDSTIIWTYDPSNNQSYIEPFKKCFLKQLIKKKIIQIKTVNIKVTKSNRLVAFKIDFFLYLFYVMIDYS